MRTIKSYGCKDSDFLFAAEIIAETLKARLNVLSNIRKQWTEPYTDNLTVRIRDAIKNYLNNDSQRTLRNATAKVKSTMERATKSLTFFKTQLSIDFKNEPVQKDEILETLGFKKYYKKVLSKNQNALLQFLLAFKTNLTEDIRNQLTSKGFNPVELDEIIDLADIFKNANLNQENAKANKKQISQEKRMVLNALGNEVKGICKLASLKINDNPALKELFNFNKVVAQVANVRKTKTENKNDTAKNKTENQGNIIH